MEEAEQESGQHSGQMDNARHLEWEHAARYCLVAGREGAEAVAACGNMLAFETHPGIADIECPLNGAFEHLKEWATL